MSNEKLKIRRLQFYALSLASAGFVFALIGYVLAGYVERTIGTILVVASVTVGGLGVASGIGLTIYSGARKFEDRG